MTSRRSLPRNNKEREWIPIHMAGHSPSLFIVFPKLYGQAAHRQSMRSDDEEDEDEYDENEDNEDEVGRPVVLLPFTTLFE